MTEMPPAPETAGSGQTRDLSRPAASAREAWEQTRRAMERGKAFFGPDGRRSRRPERLFSAGTRMFDLGSRLIGIHRRGRRNALAVGLATLSLSFPDLPSAFDGYRILHLSDTHLDCLPELAVVASGLLAGLRVDLLALTGDVHGRHRSPIAASVRPLADLVAGVRVSGHRLAVLGNHDPADMAAALEGLGFEVLINRSAILEKRGQRIVVTGLDDVHRFFTQDALGALSQKFEGFRIALVHSPEVADHAAAAGCALYLSGHTHGGQICWPGGRPVVTRLRRCRHASAGVWKEGGMTGYTSRGLGVGDVPMRFNCPGEMTVITLQTG